MAVYYNEFDPFKAAWLRELMKVGVIADGEIDERSISDVIPSDLAGFTQCHFFAGIGVWSYALRNAGWPDDRPVWTASCPCQPFSNAGKGAGFADERHLWPALFHLISVSTPPYVFGEQVASKVGLAWIDLVHADMEGQGYTCGANDTCAAGFGATHVRQRLYWVAHPRRSRHEHWGEFGVLERQAGEEQGEIQGWERRGNADSDGRPTRRLADTMLCRTEHGSREGVGTQTKALSQDRDLPGERLRAGVEGAACGMADASGEGLQVCELKDIRGERGRQKRGATKQCSETPGPSRPGPANGFWRDADWLFCRDGKWRPVEPGAFPLATESPARMGRVRGYGDAIVAEQAQAFIEAYIEEIETQISKSV